MHCQAITPVLNISDMEQSFQWFAQLGWNKSWDWGDPPSFGCVGSGECEIFLCLNGQGGRGRGVNTGTFHGQDGETADKGVWLTLWVEDVDQVYQSCRDKSIEVMLEPEDMPWGVRELHVRHPDGHVFRISQGLDSMC